MLEEGKIQLASVNEGIKTVKRRLGRKRVLIVLDDVDDIKQLEILAGERDWFGSGSRIIITTRDKHLLDVHEVEKIYEMNVLKDPESLELFCQNAFKRSRPAPTYEDLSNRAIRYAKGLPLALKVIGSHLFRKNLGEWKSALDKYEESPHEDIQSILRISYDSLHRNEKDIFLDIACFFKGQRLEYVKKILDACEFYPEDGIRVLVDKSLVTVEYDCLKMHDLIQDIGREIVKQEAPEEVGERSRLWFYEDVLEVLTQNTGSSKIKGIILDPPKEKTMGWIDHTAFVKMKNLRILIVRNTIFLCGPNYLSNNLRLLEWNAYPSRSFPRDFYPKKIVVLNLRRSRLILDKSFQRFEHLTYMAISSIFVSQFPNVSGAQNLRELRLDKCLKLVKVHELVGFLPNLVYLRASDCTLLRCFLPRICLPSLEYLSFNFCARLAHFPDIVGNMDKPLKINMTRTAIKELPRSIGKLSGLNYLEMTSCKELQDLPNSLFMLPNFVTLKIGGCSQLRESFRSFKGSLSIAECRPNLGTLHFGNAGLSDEDLHVIIQSFPNLKDLNVSGNNFVSIPTHIKESVYLTSLDVSCCKELEEIPELPSSIQKVDARHCHSLTLHALSTLWSQVCKEMNRLEVMMPSLQQIEEQELEEVMHHSLLEIEEEALQEIKEAMILKMLIPEWFDHRNKGGIPVFRARGKFPVVALAFVFGFDEENVMADSSRNRWKVVGLHLFIEGQHVHRKQYRKFTVVNQHVLLCDLRVLFSDEDWEGLDARVGDDNDWKTVHVDCETDLTLCCWGVYVYKHETNMDDIQFTNPDPSSSSGISTNKSRSLVPMSQEEKVWRKIESLHLPESYEEWLDTDWGEMWCLKYIFEAHEVKTLGAAMSRRVVALRERISSGSKLEDEEDEEIDFMLQRFARTSSSDDEEDFTCTCLVVFSFLKNLLCNCYSFCSLMLA